MTEAKILYVSGTISNLEMYQQHQSQVNSSSIGSCKNLTEREKTSITSEGFFGFSCMSVNVLMYLCLYIY